MATQLNYTDSFAIIASRRHPRGSIIVDKVGSDKVQMNSAFTQQNVLGTTLYSDLTDENNNPFASQAAVIAWTDLNFKSASGVGALNYTRKNISPQLFDVNTMIVDNSYVRTADGVLDVATGWKVGKINAPVGATVLSLSGWNASTKNISFRDVSNAVISHAQLTSSSVSIAIPGGTDNIIFIIKQDTDATSVYSTLMVTATAAPVEYIAPTFLANTLESYPLYASTAERLLSHPTVVTSTWKIATTPFAQHHVTTETDAITVTALPGEQGVIALYGYGTVLLNSTPFEVSYGQIVFVRVISTDTIGFSILSTGFTHPVLERFKLTKADWNLLTGIEPEFYTKKVASNIRRTTLRWSYDGTRDINVDLGQDGTATNQPFSDTITNIGFHALPLKTDATPYNVIATGAATEGGGDDSATPGLATFSSSSPIAGDFSGGNHGSTYTAAYLMYAATHGLVYNDCGSIGTGANGKKVILMVAGADPNYFRVLGHNTVDGSGFRKVEDPLAVTSPIVFATPSGSKSVTVTGTPTLSPFYEYKNVIKDIWVNGQLVDKDDPAGITITNGKDIKILESYDTLNLWTLPAIWAANRPGGGYISQPDVHLADAQFRITNLYNCVGVAKWVIYHSFDNYCSDLKQVSYGGTQMQLAGGYTELMRYFPNVLPKSDGTTTHDYRIGDSVVSDPWRIDSGEVDPSDLDGGRLFSRMFDVVTGNVHGAYAHNVNLGHIPQYTSFDEKSVDYTYWAFYSTNKRYPYPYATKEPVKGNIRFVSFRGIDPATSVSGFTNFAIYRAFGRDYVMMDFHTASTYDISAFRPRGKFLHISEAHNATIVGDIVTVAFGGGTAYAYIIGELSTDDATQLATQAFVLANKGGGGSGTVNSGTIHRLAYYAATGTAVSGTPVIIVDGSNNVDISGGSGVLKGNAASLLLDNGYQAALTTANGDSVTLNNTYGFTYASVAYGDLIKSDRQGQVQISPNYPALGSVSIGKNGVADASAILELGGTGKGFLPTRMTTTQRNAISSPQEGLITYDTTLHKLFVYDGSTWQACW